MQILRSDGTIVYSGAVIASFADTSVSPDASYSYTVTTSNSNGSSSSSASATAGPNTPSITATPNSNGTEIDLAFSADSTATFMTVWRNGTQIYSGGIIPSLPDTGLLPDSSYTYLLTTTNR